MGRLRKSGALEYLKQLEEQKIDFNTAFCRVSGWITEAAKDTPNAVYSTKGIATIFEHLFEMLQNDDSPEAATPRESIK